MNIISVDTNGRLAFESGLICFNSNFLFVDNTLYKLEDLPRKIMSFDHYITSCAVDGGYLAFSTSDSVYLFDLMTHQSCHDPLHHHLESQIILYRGIAPGLVLALARFVVVYIESRVVVYTLEGNLMKSMELDRPAETQVYGGYVVFRFDGRIGIVDVNKAEPVYYLEGRVRHIGLGDKILLLRRGEIVDLNGSVIISDVHQSVFKVYSCDDYLLCAMPQAILCYKGYKHLRTVHLDELISDCFFSNDFIVAVDSLSKTIKIWKLNLEDRQLNQVHQVEETYSDDFSNEFLESVESVEPAEPVQEESKCSSSHESLQQSEETCPVLVRPSEELNVIMSFEPSSALLNNFSKPDKKDLKKNKKAINDRPVTFHKKIKSSGYGSQARPTKKPKNLLAKVQSYPNSGSAPSNVVEDASKDILIHNGPIFNVAYDRTGSRLATCGGDSAAYILKLPLAKYKNERIPLVGHEFQVNSIMWSASCGSVLTTSNKYCVKLWNLAGSKPGECLLSINGNYSDGKFYYVDKFISLISGNEILLFRYKLRDPHLKDDIKRLQAKCQFKQVLKLKQSQTQSITRTAAHNDFHSHIMLSAGSSKIVSVWDVDKQAEVCMIPTVHRKMIHTLRFFHSSDYTEGSSESCNLFLTCSSDNYLRLFDLRVATEPVLYLGHKNTALELGASFSPCLQYVASGSEDRSAYIWDLRTSKVLSRLKGFRDATNDVTWNPAFQQVCVAGNDGRLRFFQ